ncbi:hypothetical protein QLX52_28750 [Streptomyces albus]|uniref:hypothetical protein n=1 Tax=Streptomyces TaxID=1883 RepID=UPI001CEC9949|nr:MULTISPECIES: hypothetical protein [Streptomyces]MDI6412797.1 hypothetical protein [Streptomyces albus]
MNHAARRIGRSLALVLPVVLVLSGTLAVTRVPWDSPADSQVLTASARDASASTPDAASPDASPSDASSSGASTPASSGAPVTPGTPGTATAQQAPQDSLRDRLIAELQEKDPGAALTGLQRAITRKPSLARHCASIARALGKAAVHKYGPQRAQSFSRPVCDTSFATGVAQLS